MRLSIQRLFVVEGAAVGLLSIDGASVPECFTLEDQPREEKIAGETCIPAGVYQLALRTHGDLYRRYSSRYPWTAPGMLEVLEVPGFTDILIHCGNRKEETSGCILIGFGAFVFGSLSESMQAYRDLYVKVSGALLKGAPCSLEVR